MSKFVDFILITIYVVALMMLCIFSFWELKVKKNVKTYVDEIIVTEYQEPIIERLDTLIVIYNGRKYTN